MAPLGTRSQQRRRPKRALQQLVAAVTAVAVITAGCSSSERPDSLALADTPTTTTTVAPTTTTTAAPTTTTTAAPTTTTIAPDPFRTWVATAKPEITHLVAFDEPDGNIVPMEFLVPNPHQFGGPLALMVTEGQPGDEWVQVQLPIRPNGQTGWIQTAGYDIAGTRVRAEVNLTERQVTVYDGEDVIAETKAVIGKSSTPTPLGTFYVAAIRENPPSESYIGPWALALSAYSEVYDTFSGGLPVIAIHGTTRPDQVGESRSNGCVRIPNDVVTFLAENVPLGSPVTITA